MQIYYWPYLFFKSHPGKKTDLFIATFKSSQKLRVPKVLIVHCYNCDQTGHSAKSLGRQFRKKTCPTLTFTTLKHLTNAFPSTQTNMQRQLAAMKLISRLFISSLTCPTGHYTNVSWFIKKDFYYVSKTFLKISYNVNFTEDNIITQSLLY